MTVAGSAVCLHGGPDRLGLPFDKYRGLSHETVTAANATEVKRLACMLRRGGCAVLRDSHATDWINSGHTHLLD
jgi:hypothetical protein